MAVSDPRLGMVCSAFSRHLRKHPMPDEEIESALVFVKKMVDAILTGKSDAMPDVPDIATAQAV